MANLQRLDDLEADDRRTASTAETTLERLDRLERESAGTPDEDDAQRQEIISDVRKGLRVTEEEAGRIADVAGVADTVLQLAKHFGARWNDSLATFVGAPGDLTNLVIELATGEEGKFAGKETFESAARRAGFRGFRKDLPKPTAGQRFAGRVAEEFAFALIPGGLIQRAATKTAALGFGEMQAGFGRRVMEPVLKFAREKPARFAGSELTAAAGAGVAAQTAREAGGGPTAESLALMAGSFAPGAITGTFRAGKQQVVQLYRQTTQAGRRKAVAEHLFEIATDPQVVIQRLNAGHPPLSNAEFTAAQIANDPGLLRLERGLVKGMSEVTGDFETAVANTTKSIKSEIDAALGGPPADDTIRQIFEGRIDNLVRVLKRRVDVAVATTRKRVEAIEPRSRDKEALSQIARGELDIGYMEGQTQVSNMWNYGRKVVKPSDRPALKTAREHIVAPSDDLKYKFEEIRIEAAKSDAVEDVPMKLYRVIGPPPGAPRKRPAPAVEFGATETVDRFLKLRSRILAMKRAENAKDAPNRKLLKNLDDLQATIMNTFDGLQGKIKGQLGKQIDAAVAFTREFNDLYTRGPVGKLLGYDPQGALKIADIETLESFLVTGAKGAKGVEALVAATDSQRLQDATVDFMKTMFFEQAVDDALKVNFRAAKRFVEKYDGILRRMPELKAELADVTSAQALVGRFARSEARLTKKVLDTTKSRAALFVDTEPQKALQKALRSNDPKAAMTEIVKQAQNQDPSGRALQGLRQIFSEQMLARIQMQGQEDMLGNFRFSAAKTREFNRQNRAAMTALYTPEQLARWDIVTEAITIVSRSAAGGALKGSDTIPAASILVEFAARITGARLGAQLGAATTGSALVTAGATSRMFRGVVKGVPEREMRELTSAALMDGKIMQTLLMSVKPRTVQEITRRLHGHLISLGLREPTEEKEEL